MIRKENHRNENKVEQKGLARILVTPANSKLLAVSPPSALFPKSSRPCFPSLPVPRALPACHPSSVLQQHTFPLKGLPCKSHQPSFHSFASCSALSLTSHVGDLFFSPPRTQQVADFLQLQFNSIISKPQRD